MLTLQALPLRIDSFPINQAVASCNASFAAKPPRAPRPAKSAKARQDFFLMRAAGVGASRHERASPLD